MWRWCHHLGCQGVAIKTIHVTPTTIADSVGDSVGDMARMGSDLYCSLTKSTATALVIGTFIALTGEWDA